MIEMSLEDELPDEFRGGTLRINKADSSALVSPDKSKEKPSSTNGERNNCQWGSFVLPLSLSSIPNKITETIWNTKPKPVTPTIEKDSSLQPSININEDANNFFTYRDGVIDRAVRECTEQFLDLETEGPLLASFLLTQINHWDTDKERLVLLTAKSLVVTKYDFIALKRLGYKKIPLGEIEAIMIGNLVYPNGSLIPDRNMKGIRILFGKGQTMNFTKKWNPFSEDIPFWTLTFHPLYFHKDCTDENLRNLYNLELFAEILCSTVANVNKTNETSIILHSHILLENYVGLGSIIHNRNELGFFKVRGKFSF